jgi:hypothetical protein
MLEQMFDMSTAKVAGLSLAARVAGAQVGI